MIKLPQSVKRSVTVLLMATLILGSTTHVQATSTQQKLNDVNNKISNLESEKAALQEEIDAANAELVNLLVDVGILEEEIAENEKQLKQVETKLEEAKETEQRQYEAMKKRIKFMYEQGSKSAMTAVLESKSIADLLNRVEYINEVYDYDRDLLGKYENARMKVEELKAQVEDERMELQAAKEIYDQQQQQLELVMADLEQQQSNAEAQLASARSLASQYRQTIAAQNQVITGGGSSGGGSAPTGNLNPPFTTGISGQDVVNYAMKFVGNPYVWGGKDPNTGADCSGFTSYVYAHFGINIPSYSGAQRSCGKEVSYNNAQPGDLICYAGHVAIYMGNGQIVHAKGRNYGIVAYDNATYRTIISVRRLL